MISVAALCPHPPLLFRELAGAQDAAADLRAACSEAVGALLASEPEAVVVVGAADSGRTWDADLPLDVGRFGAHQAASGHGLPLSLGVGDRLLQEAGWAGVTLPVSIGWDAAGAEIRALAEALLEDEDEVALLVLGDGSARRSEKAPGHLDDRAEPFDRSLAAAVAGSDAKALCRLDTGLAEQLAVAGRSPLRLLGEVGVRAGVREARLLYDEAPFGVGYLVAVWSLGAG